MVEWYLWVSEIRCSWLDVRTVGWCGLCSFHHLLIWKCFFWTINSSFITLFLSFSSCSSQSDHTRVKEEGSTMNSLVPGPWSLVPGPWSLVPVPRSLGPGPSSLGPGPSTERIQIFFFCSSSWWTGLVSKSSRLEERERHKESRLANTSEQIWLFSNSTAVMFFSAAE